MAWRPDFARWARLASTLAGFVVYAALADPAPARATGASKPPGCLHEACMVARADVCCPTGSSWSTLPEGGCNEVASCAAACDGGDGVACARAGWLSRHPSTGEGDQARAYVYFDKGCRLGACAACWLGCGDYRGDYLGSPRFEETFARDEAGCKAGDPNACRKMAKLYLRLPRYAELEQRACDLGSAEACAELYDALAKREIMARQPDGTWGQWTPPPDMLRKLIERACALGHVRSCVTVGAWRAREPVPGVPTPRAIETRWKRATELLDPLCRRGEASACRTLGEVRGELAAEPGRPASWDLGVERLYHDHACSMGDAEGCRLLGVALLREQGFKGDTREAAGALQLGCSLGSGRACVALSQITADKRKAQDLIDVACERGQRGLMGIYQNAGILELPQPLNCSHRRGWNRRHAR